MRFVAYARLANGETLEAPFNVNSEEYAPSVAADAGLAALKEAGARLPDPKLERVRDGALEDDEVAEWGYHEAPPADLGITADDIADQDPDRPLSRNPDQPAGPITQEELEARGTEPEVTTPVEPKGR